MLFQEMMVDAFSQHFKLAGQTVLELAADPSFFSARAMIDRGAQRVISSDIHDIWHGTTEPGVETAIIDARYTDAVLPVHSVDAVYAINALEHFPDLPQIMESLAKCVRPGGCVFLHGHPLWTSARGHHALLGSPAGWAMHFADETNPIPLWGHLTMDREELRSHLSNSPQPVIDAALKWIFDSDEITRTPRRKIIEAVTGGPFETVSMWEDRLEAPDAESISRLKASKWWDPEEDYSSRGITFVLQAR